MKSFEKNEKFWKKMKSFEKKWKVLNKNKKFWKKKWKLLKKMKSFEKNEKFWKKWKLLKKMKSFEFFGFLCLSYMYFKFSRFFKPWPWPRIVAACSCICAIWSFWSTIAARNLRIVSFKSAPCARSASSNFVSSRNFAPDKSISSRNSSSFSRATSAISVSSSCNSSGKVVKLRIREIQKIEKWQFRAKF